MTDLIVTKLRRLSVVTQGCLQQLACLGNKATIANLALIQGIPEQSAISQLRAAVSTGLLIRQEETAALKKNLREREISELPDSEETTDQKIKAITALIGAIEGSAYIGSTPQVFPLLVTKGVNYALKYGVTKTCC